MLLTALLYSFAVSIAVNTAGPSQPVHINYEINDTGAYLSKISLNVSEHTPQSSLSSANAKNSLPQNFKIPFTGLFVSVTEVSHTLIQPFSRYVKISGNLEAVFKGIDIIYPFHSFW